MAIALDANLGSSDANTGTTMTIVTTAAAVAGARIVVLISAWNGNAAGAVSAVNDGSAYTRDKNTDNGNDFFEIWSRHAAAGLASGSTITVTLSGTTGGGGVLAGAVSFTGILTSGALVTTSSSTGTGTAWSSGAATNTGFADALYIGGAGNENPTAATSSTATNGTEVHDRYRAGDQQGLVTGFLVVSTVASRAITGNFSNANSTANTGALAVYAADAVAEVPPPNLMMSPYQGAY